MRYWLLKIAK